jgi:hypothetical protein
MSALSENWNSSETVQMTVEKAELALFRLPAAATIVFADQVVTTTSAVVRRGPTLRYPCGTPDSK